MDYPEYLRPTEFEEIELPNGSRVSIPKATLVFEAWAGRQVADSYGGKTVLAFEATPVFAELAILRHFQRAGWQGVWVDTYRRKYRVEYWDDEQVKLPRSRDSVQLPFEQEELLQRLRNAIQKRWSGCWDVFCWKHGDVLFAEAKRYGKDKIRQSQRQWLESALASGLSKEEFLVVEWSVS